MVSTSVVERIVQSLAFEVEAIQPNGPAEISNDNTTPLKLRIKVKKKEDCEIEQAILSVPKFGHPERGPERIRLISSDQTIMSFNVSMEADFTKKTRRKSRKSFLGGCLGLQYDDDESTYLPSNLYNAKMADGNVSSKSDGVLKQHFILSKTTDDSGELQPYTRKRDLLGQCKPGGCLDPPFGEEKYAYKPVRKQNHKRKITSNNEEVTPAKNKLQKYVDVPKSPDMPKKNKDTFSTHKTNLNIKDNSILSLYEAMSKGSSDSKKSDSVITYPPEILSSITSYDKSRIKATKEDRQRYSANDSVNAFFTSRRKSSRLSEKSKDFKDTKTKNHEIANAGKRVSNLSENILRSNGIKPTESFIQKEFSGIKSNDLTNYEMYSNNIMLQKLSQDNKRDDTDKFVKTEENENHVLYYPNSLLTVPSTLSPSLVDSELVDKALRISSLDTFIDDRDIITQDDDVLLDQESINKEYDFQLQQNQIADYINVPETLGMTGLVASSLIDKAEQRYHIKAINDNYENITKKENVLLRQEYTKIDNFRIEQKHIPKQDEVSDALTETLVDANLKDRNPQISSVSAIYSERAIVSKDGNELFKQESNDLNEFQIKQNQVTGYSNGRGILVSTASVASSLLDEAPAASFIDASNNDRQIISNNENESFKQSSSKTDDSYIKQTQIAENNKQSDTIALAKVDSTLIDKAFHTSSDPEISKNGKVLLEQESTNVNDLEIKPNQITEYSRLQSRHQNERSELKIKEEKQILESKVLDIQNDERSEGNIETNGGLLNENGRKTVTKPIIQSNSLLSSLTAETSSKSKLNPIEPENPNQESSVMTSESVQSTVAESFYKSSITSQNKISHNSNLHDTTSTLNNHKVRKTSAKLNNGVIKNENNFLDESKVFEALGLQNTDTKRNWEKEENIEKTNESNGNKEAVDAQNNNQDYIGYDNDNVKSASLKLHEEDIEIITSSSQNITDMKNKLLRSSYSNDNHTKTTEKKDSYAMNDISKEPVNYSEFSENNFGSLSLSPKSAQSIPAKSDVSDCIQQPIQPSETASIKRIPRLGPQKPSYTHTIHNNNSFESKSKSSRESKSSLKKDVISLDLAFQSYVNERKERTLKTIEASKNHDSNLKDAITVIQSQLRPNVNEIRVPVDLENDMIIQIKRTRSPTQRVQIIDGSSIESERDIILQRDRDVPEKSFHNSRTRETYDKVACVEMQKALSNVYEQELVPLQNTIKNLQQDIEKIFGQQYLLREEFCKSLKAKPVRLVRVNSRCCCWRK